MSEVYIDITFSMRLASSANLREHWAQKAKRIKEQRQIVRIMLRQAGGQWMREKNFPVRVTITRISSRMLDSDNWQNAAKATRDEIATWMRRQDNDPAIAWVYCQQKGKPKESAVSIKVESQ